MGWCTNLSSMGLYGTASFRFCTHGKVCGAHGAQPRHGPFLSLRIIDTPFAGYQGNLEGKLNEHGAGVLPLGNPACLAALHRPWKPPGIYGSLALTLGGRNLSTMGLRRPSTISMGGGL